MDFCLEPVYTQCTRWRNGQLGALASLLTTVHPKECKEDDGRDGDVVEMVGALQRESSMLSLDRS